MLRKLLSLLLVLVFAFSFFGQVQPAQASARTASWVVSVTYQNVGTNPTPVQVYFYAEDSSTAIPFEPLGAGNTLAAGAGASFFIGNVSGISTGFRGNAVISAQEPLVATVVQFSQDPGFKMRLLSNGFRESDGSNQYLIATALLNRFARTTIFSIQNITSSPLTATVRFYNADASGVLAATKDHTIAANSSKYIEMDNPADTGLPAGTTVFNGSAIISAASGLVVSAASELYVNSNIAMNFEGLPLSRAGNTMYMATGLCQTFGLDTFYAVQNASLTTSATINVTYYNTDGSQRATDGPYSIGPGQKQSITTCAATPVSGGGMVGFTGSSKIVSTGAPIAVIGKAQCSTAPGTCPVAQSMVFTGFMGEPTGATRLAAPFIRWSSDANFNAATNMGGKQRSFIAIQNLGSSAAKVNVKYYSSNGTLVATHLLTIAANAKGNSDPNAAGALGQAGMNPGEFGYYTNGSFGGSVIIEAHPDNPSAQLIAIVRVQHPGAGEDYNAVAAPAP